MSEIEKTQQESPQKNTETDNTEKKIPSLSEGDFFVLLIYNFIILITLLKLAFSAYIFI